MRLENYRTECENDRRKKINEGINFCAVEHMKIIKLVSSFSLKREIFLCLKSYLDYF